MAEHAFAMLLALTRRIVINDREIRDGGWSRILVAPLRGKTIGLVGLGRIGRADGVSACSGCASGLDPISDPDFDLRHGIGRLGFEELLAESDVVSLHLPLTKVTQGLFNRDVLRMRPGSYLINTARGGLIVEADLHAPGLRSSRRRRARRVELRAPEPGNPLLQLPNVVIAHVAGIDTKSMSDMAVLAAQCVVALHQGQWPAGCVVNDELPGLDLGVG